MIYKIHTSILLIFLLTLCTFNPVFAAVKDKPDINGVGYYNTGSKIAYTAFWNLNQPNNIMAGVPNGMHTLKDIKNFLNNVTYPVSLGRESYTGTLDGVPVYNGSNIVGVRYPVVAVRTNMESLQAGDIVHLKNSPTAFMIYRGSDRNGYILLEDYYNRYSCDIHDFNLSFTGEAITFQKNFNGVPLSDSEAQTIEDTPDYDPRLSIHFNRIGMSKYHWQISSYDYDPLESPIKVENKTDSEKAQLIFSWVQNNCSYSSYYDSSGYPRNTFNMRTGNSCDQARLIVTLCHTIGLNARYHRGLCQFPAGQFEHVWAEIQVSRTQWLTADTTNPANTLGNMKFSPMIKDYGTQTSLDI